jgi:hypothetical protein
LTDLSVRFTQKASSFIADKVFPTVRVQNRSDKFFTYDRAYWFKTDAQLRGPGTESAGSGYAIGTDDFSCDVYAVHRNLSDQVRANADSPITMDRDATEFVTQHMLQRREQAWVSTYFTTSVWGTDVVGGTDFQQWDDYANSDPIRDLRNGVIAMAKETALKPNTLILGPECWDLLQDHPDYLERIKYTQKGIVSEDLVSSMIGIDKTYVAWSVKNTEQEGVTASYDFNFGKNALLLYVPKSPGLNTPAAGYTFSWTGLFGTGGNGIRIKRFRMEWIESDRVEAEEAIDQKVISAELGYYFDQAVS